MSVVQLLVDGEVDVFLLVAKPWGTRRSYEKELHSAYLFDSVPPEFIRRLSHILDGVLLGGHISHEGGCEVICSIPRMISVLRGMGYDVTPDENYDTMLEQAAIPLTAAQKRARQADIKKERDEGIVY
ncbi:hypothetical protein [Shewanella xiamenensis]|uniref:hypothetical protein n=1 Tax=Shewanella xiamenensis TaxID=332186 RepID=UPI0024A69951|nr:hypothetical protein [Shewanella xiamenensis]MDI5837813.1 hypothetical protein [Shewanella xiamenensis]MDI5841152.1 hypothetical protein [Shewanella xiamenensis]MDI5845651.1 hypothetical protein [Shewanella xiamenensis]MDI5848490.1 hypothetical protein [Shewanella xiamenensis]MDI5852844.1 hypothetical protein [Shewanella xiamenensis]